MGMFDDPIFAALAAAVTLVFAALVHHFLRPSSKKREVVDRATAEMGDLVDEGGWEDEDESAEQEKVVVEARAAPLAAAGSAGGGGGAKMSDADTINAINASWGEKSDEDVRKQRDIDDAAYDEEEEDDDDGEEEQGPFKAGDRVILGGLQKAGHLNGKHGIVAGKSKKMRYPVDLDLIDPPTKTNRISVKAENLKPEPTIDFDEGYRAAVKGGVLEEKHGKAVAFIFDTMQCLVATQFLGDQTLGTLTDLYRFRQQGGPQAMAKCNALQGSAWAMWTDPGPLGPRTGGKSVYDRLRFTLQESVVQQNGGFDKLDAKHPGGYRLIYDSMTDAKAGGGWQVRLHGMFWIAGMDPDGNGTFVVPDTNRSAVYRIVGHRAPLFIKGNRPALFRMTIVPWYGRLVWDGSLETTQQGAPVQASPELSHRLTMAVQRAIKQGRVVDRLAQLEVKDGSRKAVQAPPLRIRPNTGGSGAPGGMPGGPQRPNKPQPQPTDQEKKVVAKIAALPPSPCRDPRTFGPQNPPTPGERNGHWVFQRKGLAKEVNPRGEGVVLKGIGPGGGNPTQIGSFLCRDISKPSAVELLVALATLSVKEGKRPSMVGVDEMEVAERLGFLLKDVPGTIVFMFVQKGNAPPGARPQGGLAAAPNGLAKAAAQ